MIEKIILKKSSVLDKMPSAEQLDYGEIALNYNAEHPFLSFKDSDGDVMPLNDYSQDIAYLFSHKMDIGVLDVINENSDNIKKKLNITDFNAFKADNTKTINALDRNVSQNSSEIQEVNGIVQNHTDAIATLNTTIEQKADKTDLAEKVSKTDIVQSTGTSTTAVMSQKASTMAFAANTPSGDPMHNLYVAVGAVWNGSGVDKTYPTPWADYAEDEEDKVCVHKSGCWMYGYIGDLKNNDMAIISSLPVIYHVFPEHFADGYQGLTYVSKIRVGTTIDNSPPTGGKQEFFGSACKSIILSSLNDGLERKIPYKFDGGDYIFAQSPILKYIYGIFSIQLNNRKVFLGCKDLRIALVTEIKNNISFVDSPKLSKHCVRYMIANATDAVITITLHPEAYERAIADAGVQAALSNKTNVSLAKAE